MTHILHYDEMVEHLYISVLNNLSDAVIGLNYILDRNEKMEHQLCLEMLVSELKDVHRAVYQFAEETRNEDESI